MGHYDSYFAKDDFDLLSVEDKESYYLYFEKELEERGCLIGTYDNVTGWILRAWAKEKGYTIQHEYHKRIFQVIAD